MPGSLHPPAIPLLRRDPVAQVAPEHPAKAVQLRRDAVSGFPVVLPRKVAQQSVALRRPQRLGVSLEVDGAVGEREFGREFEGHGVGV